ncbi:hypothetical protein Q4R10_05810 [Morganella morganii]
MKELLDKKLENDIISIVEKGNEYQDNGSCTDALAKYKSAWELIPEPKFDWEISNWVSACLYSVYFDMDDFITAKEWAEITLKTKDSDIDTAPSIDLGMVCYELSQYEEAYKYFDDAYSYGKARAFKERPKKYLEFYLERKKKK